jgi:hypothetical protein
MLEAVDFDDSEDREIAKKINNQMTDNQIKDDLNDILSYMARTEVSTLNI